MNGNFDMKGFRDALDGIMPADNPRQLLKQKQSSGLITVSSASTITIVSPISMETDEGVGSPAPVRLVGSPVDRPARSVMPANFFEPKPVFFRETSLDEGRKVGGKQKRQAEPDRNPHAAKAICP
jgi:hypothetical protein